MRKMLIGALVGLVLINVFGYEFGYAITLRSLTRIFSRGPRANTLPPDPVTAPIAPTGLSPVDKTTNVPISTPIAWDSMPNATYYKVYFGTNSTSPQYIGTQVTTSYTPTLTNSTNYYWQVCAYNAANHGCCTSVIGFATVAASGTPPSAPINLIPINGAESVSTSPVLSWDASTGATLYDVYFGQTAPPAFLTTTVTQGHQLTGLTYLTQYFWSVCARNSDGQSCTGPQGFRVTAQPSDPASLLTSGEWYVVPNSDLLSLSVFNPAHLPTASSNIFAYSGGVYDSVRNRVLIRGGGHVAYPGGEIYAFNLYNGQSNDYQWEMVSEQTTAAVVNNGIHASYDDALTSYNTCQSDPATCSSCQASPSAYGCTIPWLPAEGASNYCGYNIANGLYSDGKPMSFHSYAAINYHTAWDALIEPIHAGAQDAAPCYTNQYQKGGFFWKYDITTNTWKHDMPMTTRIWDMTYGTQGVTLVDSSGNIWLFQEGGRQYIFECVRSGNTCTWQEYSTSSGISGLGRVVGAIDTTRDIAILAGNNKFAVWCLSSNCTSSTPPVLLSSTYTGDSGLVTANGVGLSWDSSTGLFVGWVGLTGNTGDVYVLKVDADAAIYHFTKFTSVGAVTPPVRYQSDGALGPFGRWVYSPTQNLFALVGRTNSGAQNVYLYKFSSLVTDTTPPVISSFTAGTPSGYTIPIAAFAATDNDRVAGYAITESPVPPKAWTNAYTVTAPTAYTVTSNGVYDLYAWVHDIHGNISQYAIQTVEVGTVVRTVAPSGGDYTKISDAIAWANSYGPGAVVQIDATGNPWQSWRAYPGIGTSCIDKATNFYDNVIGSITASGITIRGINGVAQLQWLCHDATDTNSDYKVSAPSALSNGSMIWQRNTASRLRIENLDIEGVGGDGSGLKVEDKDYTTGVAPTWLYVKNCVFHDNSYGGILAGATYGMDTVIVGSQFYHNGRYYSQGGQIHNIYIGESNSFTLFDSSSREAYRGILVKSRASKNYILYNRLTDEGAAGLCATQTYCSDKNVDLSYGGESYIIGNTFEKSIKDNQDGTFVSFNAEQRFTAYFTLGGTAALTDFQNIILTNTRTGHTWKPGYVYRSASYGFSGSWGTGNQTGAITVYKIDGTKARYADIVPSPACGSNCEFQNGDTLTYTGGSITITAPESFSPAIYATTPGIHLAWSFGSSPVNNGFYLVNNTFVNRYSYVNGGAYVTYPYYDSTYVRTQNNLFVDLQTGAFPLRIVPSSPVTVPTESNNLWVLSDPGFTSIGTYDYSLTAGSLATVGVSTSISDILGLSLKPLYEYVNPALKQNRYIPGCRGAYGYSTNCQ